MYCAGMASKFIGEFKEFAVKGNLVDMAVGFILGGGLAAVVKVFVEQVLMPPVGLVLGGVDFANLFIVLREGTPPAPYATMADASAAGAVTLGYGLVVNSVITFLVVAFAAFILVRGVNRLRRQQSDPAQPPADPVTRNCPRCIAEIPKAATRCSHCTSDVEPIPM